MQLNINGQAIDEEDLVRYVWTTGALLEERCDPLQLELSEMYSRMAPRTTAFLLESRKNGKTYGLMEYADRLARVNPGSIVRFVYPTKIQGKSILGPIFDELFADCPKDLRWVNREQQDGCWMLFNGSRLYLAGTDDADQIDRLRGPKSNLNILDEVTTFNPKNLMYLVNSILWPQTLNTGGLTLMSGTAPVSLDHPSVELIETAQIEGHLITKTIFDNPRLSLDVIFGICKHTNPKATEEELKAIMSGEMEGSPTWEREFKCRLIADNEMRVCPEFAKNDHMGRAPQGFPVHKFVFMDPGFVKDFFGVVFCELDFRNQVLYVRRDFAKLRQGTDDLRKQFMKIEEDLGWHKSYAKGTISRYMDETAKQQIYDFNTGGYRVMPAMKSPGKGPLVVEMRNKFSAGQVMIAPECTHLINCLENGIWSDNTKEDFKRSANLGHLDTLDALAQGCLTLKITGKWQQSPFPKGTAAHYEMGIAQPIIKTNMLTKNSLTSNINKMIPRMLTSRKGRIG